MFVELHRLTAQHVFGLDVAHAVDAGAAFAQLIGSRLSAEGYTPVLCTQAPGGVHEDEYVEMLLDRSIAGIVYVSGHHANLDSDIDRYLSLIAKGVDAKAACRVALVRPITDDPDMRDALDAAVSTFF